MVLFALSLSSSRWWFYRASSIEAEIRRNSVRFRASWLRVLLGRRGRPMARFRRGACELGKDIDERVKAFLGRPPSQEGWPHLRLAARGRLGGPLVRSRLASRSCAVHPGPRIQDIVRFQPAATCLVNAEAHEVEFDFGVGIGRYGDSDPHLLRQPAAHVGEVQPSDWAFRSRAQPRSTAHRLTRSRSRS